MTKKPLFHILFYIAGFILLFISNRIDPTSLAGPGLDLVFLLFFAIVILSLLIKNFISKNIIRNKIIILIIHVIGILIVSWMLSQPTDRGKMLPFI